MKTLVVGFPYVRERYFATFRDPSIRDDVLFLLPQRWTAKNGRVVFAPPEDERVMKTIAYFHDSHTPIVGGLLKGWMPLFPLYLWRLRHTVSLVYSCSEPTLLTTLYQVAWSRIFGKKHVCFTWENIHYTEKLSPLSRGVHVWILKLVLKLSDGLICGNAAGRVIHYSYASIPMEIIPMNGVDVQFFSRPSSGSRVFQGRDFSNNRIITFIGAMGKRKGLDVLLEAFSELVKQSPDVRLILAGSGEYEQEIARRIKLLGIEDSVIRYAWLDDAGVRDLLTLSDVFAYPSIQYGGWTEQFGYSMAEAMSMEVPVISTRTGSIPDVVTHTVTGLLVTPNSVEELLEALTTLVNDNELRRRLGRQARVDVERRFSHAVIARRFVQFFTRIYNSA